jgi:Arc-like DNA binding domain
MSPKSPELRPVMVRLPEPVRVQLTQLAAFNGRSMNAEIIYRLERSLAEEKATRRRPEPAIAERLDQIEKTLESFKGVLKAQQTVALELAKRLDKTSEPGEQSK